MTIEHQPLEEIIGEVNGEQCQDTEDECAIRPEEKCARRAPEQRVIFGSPDEDSDEKELTVFIEECVDLIGPFVKQKQSPFTISLSSFTFVKSVRSGRDRGNMNK
jgi:hypothetical protein